MIRAVILIPVTDNSGDPFPGQHWQRLEERLLEVTGGCTRHHDVSGAWRNPAGIIYGDVSGQYVVYLESFRQLATWITVVDWSREHFHQEAIATEVNGYSEIFGRQ